MESRIVVQKTKIPLAFYKTSSVSLVATGFPTWHCNEGPLKNAAACIRFTKPFPIQLRKSKNKNKMSSKNVWHTNINSRSLLQKFPYALEHHYNNAVLIHHEVKRYQKLWLMTSPPLFNYGMNVNYKKDFQTSDIYTIYMVGRHVLVMSTR